MQASGYHYDYSHGYGYGYSDCYGYGYSYSYGYSCAYTYAYTYAYAFPALRQAVVREFSNAYYIYQFALFSVWLWFSYLFVGSLLLSIVFASAFLNIFINRRNQLQIQALKPQVAPEFAVDCSS